jgi:tRNA threonylcarbamoyladenosine biosynthesis protein TsaE
MKIIIKHLKGLPQAARKFLILTDKNRLFAFYGSMGAGKTTIIKAICEEMGAIDPVSSPTFTLVNEYKTKEGSSLYHIDFFRIRKLSEVFDFGIEEYLSSGSFCFMEWPEIVEEILPAGTVKVKIDVGKNDERIILIHQP